MEQNKECNELLDNILKELVTAKEQGIKISEKLNDQTSTLSNTSSKLEKIENETQTSTWYINYMKATFGKIYKRCNNFPARVKTSTIGRKLRLTTEIALANHKNNMKQETKQEYVNNDKMSKISSIISDINYISTVNGNEIDKQNKILDYNVEIADSTEENIFNNRLKIRKILD
jgi:hypothetical protein